MLSGVSLPHNKPYSNVLTQTLPVSTLKAEEGSNDDSAAFVVLQKCEFVTILLLTIALAFTKLSIVLLCMRLFTQSKNLRWIIRLLLFVVFCWSVIGDGDHLVKRSRWLTHNVKYKNFPLYIFLQTNFRLLISPKYRRLPILDSQSWATCCHACCS